MNDILIFVVVFTQNKIIPWERFSQHLLICEVYPSQKVCNASQKKNKSKILNLFPFHVTDSFLRLPWLTVYL